MKSDSESIKQDIPQSKPRLSIINVFIMSFGFLGIQFGFALQGGNMSRIFETLGASKDAIPMYWIAAPLTGLIIQPIIGYLSDRTWHPSFGRRRPYFMIGAILASIVLFFVPTSSAVWMAVGCLWILDASINISMEPFRALVADKLPESQRSFGFVVQTLIIGVGTWVASSLPWLVNQFGVSNEADPGVVPDSVKVAFAIGAVVFMVSILITVIFTKEYSPEQINSFASRETETEGKRDVIPKTMLKLGVVQFFSWFAFFAMWSLATPALTEHVFQSPAPVAEQYDMLNESSKVAYQLANKAYNDAADLVSRDMGIYGLTSMAFALVLTLITYFMPINRKFVHLFSLIAGGGGFLYMVYGSTPETLWICFALIGIAWGSILSMPYAMLSSSIDETKMGLLMGVFNMFIVIPQIVAAVGLNFVYESIFGFETINAMLLAGCSLLIAGLSNLLITDKKAISYHPE